MICVFDYISVDVLYLIFTFLSPITVKNCAARCLDFFLHYGMLRFRRYPREFSGTNSFVV